MSHPSPFGQYHYHHWSNCIHDGPTTTIPAACIDLGDDCSENALTWALNDGWADTADFGGMVGIAKDGHPIYGPYNEDGELWTCDDHDICNGRFFDNGTYGYVSTMVHPYVLGCWGPAAYQSYSQTCSEGACGDSSTTDSVTNDTTTDEDTSSSAFAIKASIISICAIAILF